MLPGERGSMSHRYHDLSAIEKNNYLVLTDVCIIGQVS